MNSVDSIKLSAYIMNTVAKIQSEPINKDFDSLELNDEQSELFFLFSKKIVQNGGIDQKQDLTERGFFINEILKSLTNHQKAILKRYKEGEIGALFISNLLNSQGNKVNEPIPNELPLEKSLITTDIVQHIGARSSLLLELIDQKTFAYDVENYGKAIRLVANFKKSDKPCSHSGVSLSAHTETPYFCSKKHTNGHSPAPSSLILSAVWNPLDEPTNIIPMYKIIDDIQPDLLDQLKSNYYDFIRSDSFNEGEGSGGKNISILEEYIDGTYMLKFNFLRFKTSENAPILATKAIEVLKEKIMEFNPIKFSLSSTNTLIINNFKSMHCRDFIQDNRRLLVRIFGYENNIDPIVISNNPYIVKG